MFTTIESIVGDEMKLQLVAAMEVAGKSTLATPVPIVKALNVDGGWFKAVIFGFHFFSLVCTTKSVPFVP